MHKKYRENNREMELERNRQYRIDNNDKVREYARQKYAIKKQEKEKSQTEEYKEKAKEYRLVNKDKKAEKDNEKHNCGCGGCYTTRNKRAHERGKAHIYWSKTGIIPSTLPIDYNWYPHLFELMKEDNLNKA